MSVIMWLDQRCQWLEREALCATGIRAGPILDIGVWSLDLHGSDGPVSPLLSMDSAILKLQFEPHVAPSMESLTARASVVCLENRPWHSHEPAFARNSSWRFPRRRC